MQIVHTGSKDGGFRRVNENAHERRCKGAHQHTDDDAERRTAQPCTADALADAVGLARAVVLRHIGGKGIAEVLHRHVGKGVDLDCRRKSRHDHGAEAVDQPLYHEDAEIHDGLLHAGHHRKVQDGGKVLFVPPAVLFFRAELRELFQGVQSDADAGHELREGGGCRGPPHAPVPHQHAHQIQDHIEHCRHGQEQQRDHGVTDGPQEVCKVVIQKGGRDAQKNDAEIFLHQEDELFRHTQYPQDAIQPQVHQHIERHRHARDEHEGLEHALPHAGLFPAAVLHGDGCAAAHAQPQQDGGEKGHEGVGRAHRRQRIRAEKASHHPGVGDVVHLLQQVAEHQRQSKQQDALCNGAFGKTALHGSAILLLVDRIMRLMRQIGLTAGPEVFPRMIRRVDPCCRRQ